MVETRWDLVVHALVRTLVIEHVIVSEGIDKGELRKVCTEVNCPVHHPKKRPQRNADEAKWKAAQEKQRKEAAIANTTGIRVPAAIAAAVPVRLMKRDLLFVVERLSSLLDENRLAVVARQHGIKKTKDSDSMTKLFASFLRHAEESALGGLLVEITILHAATRQNATQVLRDAATAYKVDVDAIGLKVKEEFAAKEGARVAKKDIVKVNPNPGRRRRLPSDWTSPKGLPIGRPFSLPVLPTPGVAPTRRSSYALPPDGLGRLLESDLR
jgi:ParB family transcriptional regulator, chromosome partitioning protein